MNSSSDIFVHKITYRDTDGYIRTVLGLIEEKDDSFIEIQTAKNKFTINKASIVTYALTSQKFRR